jgi:hypothetical protein
MTIKHNGKVFTFSDGDMLAAVARLKQGSKYDPSTFHTTSDKKSKWHREDTDKSERDLLAECAVIEYNIARYS